MLANANLYSPVLNSAGTPDISSLDESNRGDFPPCRTSHCMSEEPVPPSTRLTAHHAERLFHRSAIHTFPNLTQTGLVAHSIHRNSITSRREEPRAASPRCRRATSTVCRGTVPHKPCHCTVMNTCLRLTQRGPFAIDILQESHQGEPQAARCFVAPRRHQHFSNRPDPAFSLNFHMWSPL